MADAMRHLLEKEAERHNIPLSGNQIDRFAIYLKLIQQWQRRAVRLVGNDDASVLVGEHVSDAFCIYACIECWKSKRVIDIGTGAGFPGICLKLVEPSVRLTLIEASARKGAFLAKIRAELALEDVVIVHDRGETAGHREGFRETFDIATLRAVTTLTRSLEIGLSFVKTGGVVVVATGGQLPDDLQRAQARAQRFGGEDLRCVEEVHGVRVRGRIVTVTKMSRTDQRFPEPRVGAT